MMVVVTDLISGMRHYYTDVKTIKFKMAFNTLVFKDGSELNFHIWIYQIEIFEDWEE